MINDFDAQPGSSSAGQSIIDEAPPSSGAVVEEAAPVTIAAPRAEPETAKHDGEVSNYPGDRLEPGDQFTSPGFEPENRRQLFDEPRDQPEYWATEYGFHFSNYSEGFRPQGIPRLEPILAPPPAKPASADAMPVARKEGFWREAKSLARDVVFAVIVAILIVVYVIQPVKVEGTSMLSNLENGERLFVNKFTYSVGTIHRGDIVVFWFPNNPSQSFIKRVIGLPGETVRGKNGVVYVNGREIQEPYLSPDHTRTPVNFQETRVELAHYFVMGDNRDASYDSRQWGTVPEKYIYGKAMFRYWPLEKFGRIETPDEDVIDGH